MTSLPSLVIPYGRQDITDEDIAAAVAILRSDYLTQGPAVPAFENALRAYAGCRHVIAMHSATAALHVACLAVDLGPGDLLWTVPNTFVASANCARYCGADVDFVDIDPLSWNLDLTALRSKLRRAASAGRLPKVVVPVHFAGLPTNQEAIRDLAVEFGFRVIEDASHAIGATRNNERVGSCRWSDITIFSFHPVKLITTGEGGAATTNDRTLAARMAMLRTHGITRDPALFASTELSDAESPPAWYYEQQLLGYNYRMTDIQAALGLSQLDRLDQYVQRRNALARRYRSLLTGLPLQLPIEDESSESAFHLFVVRVTAGEEARRRVFDYMRARGIGVNVHYVPVHLQPYYRDLGFRAGTFPEAERHGAIALSLPLFPRMTDIEQDRVVAVLRDAMKDVGAVAAV